MIYIVITKTPTKWVDIIHKSLIYYEITNELLLRLYLLQKYKIENGEVSLATTSTSSSSSSSTSPPLITPIHIIFHKCDFADFEPNLHAKMCAIWKYRLHEFHITYEYMEAVPTIPLNTEMDEKITMFKSKI